MAKEKPPSFRKSSPPWYHGTITCLAAILFCLAALYFSLTGAVVAFSNPDFTMHAWLPIVLGALSFGAFISLTLDLIRRWRGNT